jgi:hypothetical protein
MKCKIKNNEFTFYCSEFGCVARLYSVDGYMVYMFRLCGSGGMKFWKDKNRRLNGKTRNMFSKGWSKS